MKNQTVRLNNEEIFLAFEDWLHGYLSAVFTEENRTGCVSVVRAFAEFIAPEQLSESTVAQIKAFEQRANKNRSSSTPASNPHRNPLLPQFPERIVEANTTGQDF
jgi:hypothetical protein